MVEADDVAVAPREPCRGAGFGEPILNVPPSPRA
jgi:hypothetical protein